VEGSSLDQSPQDPQIIYVLWLRIVLDLFSDVRRFRRLLQRALFSQLGAFSD
jgi:hypothetical protein